MRDSSFVVTVKVGGVSNSTVWDAEKPFEIGHPFRWVMERSARGVSIRNVAAPSVAPRELDDASLARGASIELPESRGSQSAFALDIRPVHRLPPAFDTHEGEQGELRVYSCRGAWTRQSASLDEPYEARVGDKRVFTVQKRGGDYAIKADTDSLTSRDVSFERGQSVTFNREQLAGMVLSLGDSSWRFDTLKRTEAPAFAGELPEEALREAAEFRRALRGSFAAMAVLFLVAVLWPRPPADETPSPPEATRLVFKQPVKSLMTSAPSGNFAGIDTRKGARHAHRQPPRHVGVQRVARSSPDRGPRPVTHRLAERPEAQPLHSRHPVVVASHSPSRRHQAPGPLSRTPHRTPFEGRRAARPNLAQAVAQRRPHSSVSFRHSARHRAVVAAGTAPRPVARPTHHERDSAVARIFHGAGFRQAESGLLKGGMSRLLRQSSFGEGADAHSEARGLLGGRSALSAAGGMPGGGGGGGGGELGARSVRVASLGGGAGLFGDRGVGYGRGSHAKVNGQGRSFVTMDTGESDVDEGLTKEQVGRVIHSHMSEIRYCYDAAKLRDPGDEGRLAIRFTVGGSGAVIASGVNQSSVDGGLDNCVMRRLVTWRFPHPKGGVSVAVTYPFIFKTLGR